jgi:hypothetical protein
VFFYNLEIGGSAGHHGTHSVTITEGTRLIGWKWDVVCEALVTRKEDDENEKTRKAERITEELRARILDAIIAAPGISGKCLMAACEIGDKVYARETSRMHCNGVIHYKNGKRNATEWYFGPSNERPTTV